MSVRENKALVQRFNEEFFNKGNLAATDEMVAAGIVWHRPTGPDIVGVEAVKRGMSAALSAAPDYHCTLDDVIAEGDKVATRFTTRFTFKRAYGGIPPTGKQVVMWGLAISHIVDGKIAEMWTRYDSLGWAQQMGTIPTPGTAGG